MKQFFKQLSFLVFISLALPVFCEKSLDLKNAEESSVLKAASVSLTSPETLSILNEDWLKEEAPTDVAKLKVSFSKSFWVVIAILIIYFLLLFFLYIIGFLENLSLNLKLYWSYGALVILSVILGVIAYFYIGKLNNMGKLNSAYLDLDLMISEISAASNDFFVYGNKNIKYGEKLLKRVNSLLDEYTDDFISLKATGYLPLSFHEKNSAYENFINHYENIFNDSVKVFHEIDKLQKTTDELSLKVEENMRQIMQYQEDKLAELDIEAITNHEVLVGNLPKIEKNLLKTSHILAQFISDKNSRHIGTAEKELTISLGLLATLENSVSGTEIKERLKALKIDIHNYISTFKRLVENEAALIKYKALLKKDTASADRIGNALTIEASMIAEGTQKEANIISTTLIFLALILGGILAVTISRIITRPIALIVENLRRGSDNVTDASENISESSHVMAEGAGELASKLDNISKNLETVSTMAKQSYDNALQADTMSGQAISQTQKVTSAMRTMLDVINQIKNSSDETSKIIKSIDEIAFQTNLLALNAAVEAARAGEAGKGFAVVAEEVRNLAQRSANAAQHTTGLIETARNNADNGVKTTQEVDNLFNEISALIQKFSVLINEVSAASGKQADGILEVNNSISSIDRITQTNASKSKEASNTAEQLATQSQDLGNIVENLTNLLRGRKS